MHMMTMFIYCSLLIQVLRTRQAVTVHGSDSHEGLSDIAFTSIDDSRLVKEDDLREDSFLATLG
ncbi:hypothetical protein ACJW30_08G164500 [Castanea mollissima]